MKRSKNKQNLSSILFCFIMISFFFIPDRHLFAGGIFKYNAFLDLTSNYNDNILLSESNPAADSMTMVTPQVWVEYLRKSSRYNLQYAFQAVSFSQNESANYNLHTLDASGAFSFLKNQVSLAVSNSYSITVRDVQELYIYDYPISQNLIQEIPAYSEEKTERTTQEIRVPPGIAPTLYQHLTKVNTFTISPGTNFPVGRLMNLSLRYSHSLTDYEDPRAADATLNSIAVSLAKMVKKGSVNLGYNYLQGDIENIKDGTYVEMEYNAYTNLSLTPYTSLFGKYGYAVRTYKDVPVWDIELSHHFSQRNSIRFNVNKTSNLYTTGRIWDIEDENINWKYTAPFSSVSFDLLRRVDVSTLGLPEDVGPSRREKFGVRNGITWNIIQNLTWSMDTSLTKARFRGGSGDEILWSIGSGITQKIGKRGSWGLNYNHENLSSSIQDISSYRNNIYSFFLKITAL